MTALQETNDLEQVISGRKVEISSVELKNRGYCCSNYSESMEIYQLLGVKVRTALTSIQIGHITINLFENKYFAI